MPRAKEAIEIEGVRLTSPDRVLYEAQGITKRELAQYYQRVAEWVLPHLADRPLTLIRCPRGQSRECFVQRRVSESFPSTIRRVEVEEEKGGTATYISVDERGGLLYLVQIGALELHTWGARRDRLDRPDRMILDLDPDPALPFSAVVEAALHLRERLRELELESFVKTTGGKGLHLVVPLVRRSSWDEVREFARALAEEAERRDPERFVAEASKAERSGKIYLDYLRNARAASAVAPYSTRSRPGAPVSVPLAWDEVRPDLQPADLTVRTVPERLEALRSDPWEGFSRTRQSLGKAVRAHLGLE